MSENSPAKSPGSIAARIANGVVHITAGTAGRGPTRARAHMSQDVVAVVLRDCMTMSEKTLASNGSDDTVLAGRRVIQEAMRDELVALVERETGRKVEAFFSDNRTEPDMAVEVFVLVPLEADDDESR